MKRRISALALLAVLAASLILPSCGDGGGEDGLTVMGRKSDMEKSYMTAIFDLYREKTGGRINVIAYEDSEFEDKAAESFARGDVPDIFVHFHNADLDRFDVEKNFQYLEDESWADELTDSARAYCEDGGGHLLGLPFWESSVSGCYYNKKIFDELRLKPAYTQAEFDQLCEALMYTRESYTPICWPADGCTWMYQFGLDPIFADDPELLESLNAGEISYSDIPEVADMANWVSSAAEKGWFGKDYLETGWDDISDKLGSGEAVMTFIWDTWFYTDFEEGNKYSVEDFALMPVFMGTADGGTYEGGNLNMMMVNRNSGNKQLALDFLAFCASPENYNAAFDGIATVSCFKGQTTNIQSDMVTEARASIEANERVSTASRIVGYSAEDVARAFNTMFRHRTDAEGCVRLMDSYREEDAVKQGSR